MNDEPKEEKSTPEVQAFEDVSELQTKDLEQVTGGTDRPTESLSLNFTKIKVDYTPQSAD